MPHEVPRAVNVATDRRLIGNDISTVGFVVGSAANSVANSVDLNIHLAWVQGTRPVLVTLDVPIQFTGISQAAGLKVTTAPFINDYTQASFAAYDATSYVIVTHTFHDTVAAAQAAFRVQAYTLIESAPGTVVHVGGRAYNSVGAAATWQAVVGSFNSLSIITAEELA